MHAADSRSVKRTRKSWGRRKNPCQACKSAHIKCDGAWPACRHCARKNVHCTRNERHSGPDAQANAVLFRPVSDPSMNPDGIFTSLKAPMIPNMNAIWYWLDFGVHNDRTQAGWLGPMRDPWVNLMQTQEPILVSYATFWVLRLQIALGRIDDEDELVHKSKALIIRYIGQLQRVTSSSLVVVTMMALLAVRSRDIAAGEIHLSSLKHLVKGVPVSLSEWLFVWGTEWRISSYLMCATRLPYYIPPCLETTFQIPPASAIAAKRLAMTNATTIVGLLGKDYLMVLQLLEDLHCAFETKPDDEQHPWGQIYNMGWHTLIWVQKCRNEPISPTARCRTLLSLTFLLLIWRFSQGHVPTEGVLQGNILSYAKVLCKAVGNTNIVDEWPADQEIEALLWSIAIFFMESSVYCPQEDQDFWAVVLRKVAQRQGIESLLLVEEHINRWPYPKQWYESLSTRLWACIGVNDKEAELLEKAVAEARIKLVFRSQKALPKGPMML